MLDMFKRKRESKDKNNLKSSPDNLLDSLSQKEIEKLGQIYDTLNKNNGNIEKCGFKKEDLLNAVVMKAYVIKNGNRGEDQFSHFSDDQRKNAAILDASRSEHFQTVQQVNDAVGYKPPTSKSRPS